MSKINSKFDWSIIKYDQVPFLKSLFKIGKSEHTGYIIKNLKLPISRGSYNFIQHKLFYSTVVQYCILKFVIYFWHCNEF